MMFQIIGSMAEFERPLIQERVRAGLRNARATGEALGSSAHFHPCGESRTPPRTGSKLVEGFSQGRRSEGDVATQ